MPRPAHYAEYEDMTEVVPGVFIDDSDTGIYIVDDEGEVCCWVESEWIEDPTVAMTVARAVAIASSMGAQHVRANIENKGNTLMGLINRTKGARLK